MYEVSHQSPEGKKRCEKCDKECTGVYYCHAGLIDFSIDLVLNGEKVGAVIGGQVLPDHPDEEKFREVARELDINEDSYIAALKKVNVRSEAGIRAGEAGRGFTIVVNEVENLSRDSSVLNSDISKTVNQIAEVIHKLMNAQHDK